MKRIDMPFVSVILIMLIAGLVMVFSASPPRALFEKRNEFFYIIRQGIFSIIGIVAMLFMSSVNYKRIKRYAPHICTASFLLCAAVPLIGVSSKGAKRWLAIGPLQFQPSEIGKFAIIFFLAYAMSRMSDKDIKSFKKGFLPLFSILCLFLLCFVLQRHLSATVVTFGVCVLLMIVGGIALRYIFAIGALGIGAFAALAILEPYRLERLYAFKDPFLYPTDEGYHIIQSLYAIGSGGWFGRGLGQSRQKFLHLPEAHNDFIFAVICEETGFVGASVILLIFLFFVFRGMTIALKAPDKFGALVAFGFVTLLGTQMLINVAVVTSSIPVTGMQLPFFSYGGTSLVIIMAAMGVVLSISRQAELGG